MDKTTKEKIAEMICGDDQARHPVYRTSTYLTKFFQDIGINQVHDGTTRKWWTLSVIENLNGIDLQKVILRLTAPKLYGGNRDHIKLAFGKNKINYEGLLIIGRSKYLDSSKRKRLDWRNENLILNSKKIYCFTYDELYSALHDKLNYLRQLKK
ncbi:MAG TPA: Shedu anti-phage system protein SduA domain-containing protein [Cyclobacteriaceae bacterium]|nr:Shedu anti-phage system protein SduA domain-containing protein [Cyclobacteriaceae bacterium]